MKPPIWGRVLGDHAAENQRMVIEMEEGVTLARGDVLTATRTGEMMLVLDCIPRDVVLVKRGFTNSAAGLVHEDEILLTGRVQVFDAAQ